MFSLDCPIVGRVITNPYAANGDLGKKETVHCHVISADVEGAVVDNIRRKDEQHKELSIAMMEQMRDFMKKEVLGASVEVTDYEANQEIQILIWLVTKK